MTQIVKMNRSNVLVLDTYRFTQKAKINVNHLCSYDIVNSDSQILIVIFPPILMICLMPIDVTQS